MKIWILIVLIFQNNVEIPVVWIKLWNQDFQEGFQFEVKTIVFHFFYSFVASFVECFINTLDFYCKVRKSMSYYLVWSLGGRLNYRKESLSGYVTKLSTTSWIEKILQTKIHLWTSLYSIVLTLQSIFAVAGHWYIKSGLFDFYCFNGKTLWKWKQAINRYGTIFRKRKKLKN